MVFYARLALYYVAERDSFLLALYLFTYMKIAIIFSSLYGNTRRLAEIMAQALSFEDVKLLDVKEAKLSDLLGLDLLFFGSPTHGGRPQPIAQEFLDQISSNSLSGTMVAAFDTRFEASNQTLALRWLMKIIGYAAPKINRILEERGGRVIVPPAGFIVTGKEGRILDGEESRATKWSLNAYQLAKSLSKNN